MAISKAKVIEVVKHGADIREYKLKLEKNNYFEAGSFLLLSLEIQNDYTRWPESRNFSIASAYNDEGKIRLIIQKVGKYTNKIFTELNAGDTCVVKYAYGDFLLPFYDKTSPIYCITGGTGIAPILGFAEQLKQSNEQNRMHVFYSFKNMETQVGVDTLSNILPGQNIHLFSTREETENAINRRIQTSDLDGLDFDNGHFYICGGERFTNEFKKYFTSKGATNIYTDEW